jgi:hypothetical protein
MDQAFELIERQLSFLLSACIQSCHVV